MITTTINMKDIKETTRELKPKRKYRKRTIKLSDPMTAEVSIQEPTTISEPYANLGEEGEIKEKEGITEVIKPKRKYKKREETPKMVDSKEEPTKMIPPAAGIPDEKRTNKKHTTKMSEKSTDEKPLESNQESDVKTKKSDHPTKKGGCGLWFNWENQSKEVKEIKEEDNKEEDNTQRRRRQNDYELAEWISTGSNLLEVLFGMEEE